MAFDRNVPYNDLPKLPPVAGIESLKVLKKAASAHRALAELKGMIRLIPNPTILLQSLVLEEARDSSEIENVVTSRDKLYEAMATDKATDPATKEVLRYREAVWKGFKLLKKSGTLTTDIIVNMQGTFVKDKPGIRKVNGTVLANRATGEVVYTPPRGEELLHDLLGNLETYINTKDTTDSLVKLAVVHYQFEAIHPFHDGNGRTGRIVNALYLNRVRLLDSPVLYMSRYILAHRTDYYVRLRSVTESGQWEEWILYMLDAVEQTSLSTIDKVNRIKDLLEKTAEKVRTELPRIYTRELVEMLFHHPYCKISFLVDNGIAARKAAGRYLQQLEESGILSAKQSGKEVLYINKKLYNLLGGK